jgi:amino-acid N-acetyltransferase
MSDEFMALRDETDLIREVFVYSHRFSDAVFVFRIGSRVIDDPSFPGLVHDLSLLHENGIKILLVPAGGSRIDELLAIYGIETERVNGVRVSTPEAMPLIQMAAFDVATKLMNEFARNKVEAVIGNWVKARAIGVRDGVDYRDTGIIDKVNSELIAKSLEDDFVPILPCIGWNAVGEPYNISSAELATQLAVSLKARKLFFITEGEAFTSDEIKLRREGIVTHEGYVSRVTVQAAEAILRDHPAGISGIEREMLHQSIVACSGGVERVHFLDGTADGVVLKEVFSTLGYGIMVHADPFENMRPMKQEDVLDVLRIMEPNIKKGVLVRRTEDDLQRLCDDYVVYEIDRTIRGCGALHRYGPDRAEIAGVAVDENFNHLGIGQKIVEFLIGEARLLGLAGVFILTTQTADWFLSLGFVQVTPGELPPERRATYDEERKSRVYSFELR